MRINFLTFCFSSFRKSWNASRINIKFVPHNHNPHYNHHLETKGFLLQYLETCRWIMVYQWVMSLREGRCLDHLVCPQCLQLVCIPQEAYLHQVLKSFSYFKRTNFHGQKLSRMKPSANFFFLNEHKLLRLRSSSFFRVLKLSRRANLEIFRVYKLYRGSDHF